MKETRVLQVRNSFVQTVQQSFGGAGLHLATEDALAWAQNQPSGECEVHF